MANSLLNREKFPDLREFRSCPERWSRSRLPPPLCGVAVRVGDQPRREHLPYFARLNRRSEVAAHPMMVADAGAAGALGFAAGFAAGRGPDRCRSRAPAWAASRASGP